MFLARQRTYSSMVAAGAIAIAPAAIETEDTIGSINISARRAENHRLEIWELKVEFMKHFEGFLKLVNDAKTRIREVTVEETKQRTRDNPAAKLIDVREDNEWQLGRAAGSMHLAKGIIERDIEAEVPDETTEMILYCGGGFRSALAADVLQEMGYTNVYSMAGGWKAWKDEGGEIEKG